MWRSPWTATLVSFLFCLRLGQAKEGPNYTFLKNATEAPPSSYYDYIIVGGGTAGCALAATLSEKYKVLLLERGGSPYGNQNITNLSTILNTLGDTSPTSASQPFISEDGVKNTRARVLGGGTCLNAGFYSRASQRYVEEAGWDGSLVNQSYKWVEKMVSFKPQVVEWQESMKDGLLEAGITPDNGFTVDHITGTKYGGTTFDEHQHRHTAADLLQYADSSRITVILRAVVQKILFKSQDGGGESKPAAYGVEFKDSSGKKHWAYLGSEQEHRGEIILSAGALGSPQLLMLSGVGPAEHLESLGIEVVVDQPMVGQKMSDNPMNLIYIPSPVPVSISTVQTVGITSLGTFIEGLTSINLLQALSGGVIPEINNIPLERIGLLAEKIAGPLSTGYLQLKNRDPEDNPSVTFNYFQEPQDLHRCVAGLKIIFKVIESKAFSRFKDPNLSAQNMIDFIANLPLNLRPRSNYTSKSLEQFCIDTVLTIWHFHGGCRVGEVVDRDYRVMGVAGLRVVDASTFNATPGTNPQATIMMLGRYMGRQILAEGLGFQAAEHGVHLEL